jgi:hypothetical protein
MQAERDANGNWKMKRKFVFNFSTFLWSLFGGLILWLFVIYGFSHPGSKSNLADLNNFPTAKYQNSIRAASMSTPWQRDAMQPLAENPTGMGPAPRSARVASEPLAPRPGQQMTQQMTQLMGESLGSMTFGAPNPNSQAQPPARTNFARSLPPQDLLNAPPGNDSGFNSAFGSARRDFFNANSQFVPPSAVATQAVTEGQNYVDRSQTEVADSAKSLIQAFSMSQAGSGRLGALVSAFGSDSPTLGPDAEAGSRLDLGSLGQVTARPGNTVSNNYQSGGFGQGNASGNVSAAAALAAKAFANNPYAHTTTQSSGGTSRTRVVVSR